MNVRFNIRLEIIFLALCISTTVAQKNVEPEKFFSAPRSTAAGILFSDQLSNGLFLASNSGIALLSNVPGSALYYTVSPDGNFAGFKEVQANGMQIPVLYDLTNNTKTELHRGSSRIGQISFARDGSVGCTIENDLIVISGGEEKKYSLGTYSNIAPISPDGKFVVYNDDADQLWMMDLTTQERTRITDHNGSYALPQWSPDGSQILYSRLNGSMFTYSLTARSTASLGEGESPSWADNSLIVFSRKVIDHQQLVSADLYCINTGTMKKSQWTSTDEYFEADPSFDARTNSIIYTDTKRGGIYSRTLAGENKLAGEQEKIAYDNAVLQKTILARSAVPMSPSTPAAVSLDMPYVHQVWDTPDWYNGSSACGATSSIMVIAYYNIVPRWNVWCSASGSSPSHNSPYGNYVCEIYGFRELSYSYTASDPNGKTSYGGYGFMWTGSYSPYSRMVDYYGNHGLSAVRYDSNATFFETAIANVDSGYPFTICNGLTTAGHIIVINGYDVNNRTVIVNDPYGNKNSGTYPSLNGKGVKYDWVGYNNGYRNLNRIYWGVTVRYTKVSQADSIVDDAQMDKGFYLHTTSPSSVTRWYDKKSGGYYNGHFWWTRTKMSDTCYATWTPTLAKDGLYEVSAYIPYGDATKAKYIVSANDSMHTVVIDQKLIKNDWVSLGTFPFRQGKSGYVRLGDGSDTTKQGIIFDAVKWNYRGMLPTSVAAKKALPEIFTLDQNYPNPFNPPTVIEYRLPVRTAVSLKVYDVLGKETADLINEEQNAGQHRYYFSMLHGEIPSGVYFYTLRAGQFSDTKRMIILK
ncbi:MAG: C39 family peptidase [Bacteroidota bacterium]